VIDWLYVVIIVIGAIKSVRDHIENLNAFEEFSWCIMDRRRGTGTRFWGHRSRFWV